MNYIEVSALGLMTVLLFSHFVFPSLVHSTFRKIFISASLIFLWLGLLTYQAFIIEKVFSILTVSFPRTELTSFPSQELFAGEKISGDFKANHNYLGIVGFRFWNFNHLNSDFVEFRIREKGQAEWFYSNQYKTDQFLNNRYFTFGFPAINDSLGKTYEFEIESTAGIPGNAIGVSQLDPIFIAKYKYPREIITKDTQSTIRFMGIKLLNLFTNTQYSAQSFVFLLPFLVNLIFISDKIHKSASDYLAKLFGNKLKSSNKKQITLFLCYLGLLLDNLFIKDSQIPIIILITVFVYTFLTYRVKTHWYFITGLLCLFSSAIYNDFSTVALSERFGAWAWIFIFMWAIAQLKNTTFPKFNRNG